MSEQINTWYRRAKKLAKTLRHASNQFRDLSNTYEGMRDEAPNSEDRHKTLIDRGYSKVNEAKDALCALQAGGSRRGRKGRGRKTRRRHH